MAKKAAKAAPAKKSAPKKAVAKVPVAKVPAKKAVAKAEVKKAKVSTPNSKKVEKAPVAVVAKKVEAPQKKGAIANAVAKLEALKNKVTTAKNENVKKLEAMVPSILKSEKKSKKKEHVVAEVPEVAAVSSEKPLKLSKLERAKMTEDEAKWWDLHEKNKTLKAPNYDMREAFEANKPIQHKLLGWGFVLNNDNDRLEVLFKDGKRMLISNRK